LLNDLVKYKDRQTVINEYRDEELAKRSAFHFDTIKMNHNSILFVKECNTLLQIDLPSHSTIKKDSQFPNFYVLEWDLTVIEVYFP
jgi:hypothetical protein